MDHDPKQDALERVIAEARAEGITSGDLLRWVRARDGLSLRPKQRERLRAREAWITAVALGEAFSGLPADEILAQCRQAEYVAARDVITEYLLDAGWMVTEIAIALDKHHASIRVARDRIKARRVSERRAAMKVVGKAGR
jgi:uncharacterized protein YoaH (UPF0181 family)